jgi:hypothetical protein
VALAGEAADKYLNRPSRRIAISRSKGMVSAASQQQLPAPTQQQHRTRAMAAPARQRGRDHRVHARGIGSQIACGGDHRGEFRAGEVGSAARDVLQNGRGSLEDCAVFLSDDGRSALAFAFWNDDTKTICASFELGRPASESEFDHNTWTARLMQGDEWPMM